ncbi:hypothetical protein yaldo0001_9380 [Yersinia aldovae ATCC 35236]|nr:hypothetical protein yaldo0001_9380 [Yersinia aldovae ATCC 35236]
MIIVINAESYQAFTRLERGYLEPICVAIYHLYCTNIV